MADENDTCGDDDKPQLSEHALLALQEFYAEHMQLVTAIPNGSSDLDENWVSV